MVHPMFRGGLPAALALLALAAAPPAPAAAQSPCGDLYRVGESDTVRSIARQCGVTVPALLAANRGLGLRSDLELGTTIRIPDPSADAPTPREACGDFYEMRPEDTLDDVALRCGLTVPMLVAANPGIRRQGPLEPRSRRQIRIPDVHPAAVRAGAITIIERLETPLPDPGAVEPDPEAGAEGEGAEDPGGDDESDEADEADEVIEARGTLVSGQECMLLRDEDGTLVGIRGTLSGFDAGDRVTLLGTPDEEACAGAARTVRLRILWKLP